MKNNETQPNVPDDKLKFKNELNEIESRLSHSSRPRLTKLSVTVIILILFFVFFYLRPTFILDFTTYFKHHESGFSLNIKLGKILFEFSDKNKKEIRLIHLDKQIIQDISFGEQGIQKSSLSFDAEKIIFSKLNLNLFLFDLNRSTKTLIVDENKLRKNIPRLSMFNSLSLCGWGEFIWSPDSSKFIFFVCGKKRSLLVLHEINTKTYSIPVSCIDNPEPRIASWIDNSKIALTIKSTNNSLIIYDLKNMKIEKTYGPTVISTC